MTTPSIDTAYATYDYVPALDTINIIFQDHSLTLQWALRSLPKDRLGDFFTNWKAGRYHRVDGPHDDLGGLRSRSDTSPRPGIPELLTQRPLGLGAGELGPNRPDGALRLHQELDFLQGHGALVR
jgi:hypothetical protein